MEAILIRHGITNGNIEKRYIGTTDEPLIDSEKERLRKNIYPDADNNEIYIQNIEKYLGKELTTYKHTYKQNSDGTYYWYSTEPMK